MIKTLLVVACLAAPPLSAMQDPTTSAPAWPALGKDDAAKVTQIFKELRDSKADAPRAKAEEALVALGPAVAPVMLERFSDGTHNQNELVARVLDRVTSADHAPLLARRAGDSRAAMRRWVLRRLTTFRQPGLAAVFRKASSDRDAEIAFQAQLGMLSAGDLDALQPVFERASRDWADLRARLEEALPGARGEPATQKVFELMKDGNEQRLITGLRLLRFLAPKDAAGAIKIHLDSEVHNVKKEAINALRAVVDGDPALEQLSVFDAIDMAKKWKAR